MATSPQAQHYVECECGKPSEYFCNTCDIQLCKICAGAHLQVKSEKGHEITEYAKRKEKSTRCFCESHTDFECHLFCNTCGFPVCFICVSTKHKKHDMVELNEKTADIRNLIAEETQILQWEIRPVYQRALTRILSRILTVPSHFSTVRNKLTRTKAAWHKKVDDVIREFEEDVDHMEADQMVTLQKQKDIFEERLLEIDKSIQENCDAKNSTNPNILLKFRSNIKQHCDVPEVTEFNNPCFLEETVDHNDVKRNIGRLSTLESYNYSQSQIKVHLLSDYVNRLLDTPSITLAIEDTGFPPSASNNRLSCMALLSHDRIWVGSKNSTKLKLIDLQGRLLDTVTLTCNGTYFTFTRDGQIVYSDEKDNTIKMIDNNHIIQTIFSTGEWKPKGITSTTSGDILVCLFKEDQASSMVVRYSSAGHVMQEIQYDANNQPLFNNPWYITVNKNNDICVVNFNARSLVVVDESGTFRFKYDGNQKYEKIRLNTLVTDSDGNILISDYQNDIIHMIDMSGHFIGIVAPKGLERPRGICILANGNLLVGEVGTGKVKIIKYLED